MTAAKPTQPVNTVVPLPKIFVRSQAVLDAVAHLPRKHLGHAYYESKLTPRRLTPRGHNVPALSDCGFASTPQPLPRFEGRENCTFTVRIPRVYLEHTSRQEITQRRALWGTDIYTDDSDIIAACIHQGWFRGAWHADVDVSLLDLEIEGEPSSEVSHPFAILNVLTEPPPTGPMEIPPNRDCHVTIRVLPTLDKYASLVRFGIMSREWGGKHDGYKGVHDGLSFMIESVKWVEGDGGDISQKRLFDKPLEEEELELERLAVLLFNVDGQRGKSNGHFEISFERGVGSGLKFGDIKGIGTKWTKSNGTSKRKEGGTELEVPAANDQDVEMDDSIIPAPSIESDETNMKAEQENEQRKSIAQITSRMIENANSSPAATNTSTSLPTFEADATSAHGLNTLASLVDGERERRIKEEWNSGGRRFGPLPRPSMSPVSPPPPLPRRLE